MAASESGRRSGAGRWLRRRWPWLVAAGCAALLAAVAATAALAWQFSSRVVVPDRSPHSPELTVEARSANRIAIERTAATERRGRYGIEWPGGRARIGAVLGGDEETVVRRLLAVDGYLAAGMEVRSESSFYAGDPRQALGLPFETVPVPGQLGPMPAWLIDGDSATWAIVVHGINDTPEAGLRLLPTLRRMGVPAMLITYRDDDGAPSSPDGHHHMGQTEWRDLEAAARYALRHGARRFVLAGYSMGGSIIAQFMQESALAPWAAGLVLDAPALSWEAAFEQAAAEMGMPAISTLPLKLAIAARIDVDWDAVDATNHPEAFRLPVLLFHGADDDVTPISVSEELAAALPRHVTLHRVPDAGHTQSWNVAPRPYERRLGAFLTGLSAPGRERRAASEAPQAP